MKVLALVLLAAAIPAPAAPITYSITFTYTATEAVDYSGDYIAGLYAPFGSFTYDPANVGSEFSNFVVYWGNATYDFTSSANSPALAPDPVTGCSSAVPGQAYGFALLTQGVTGCDAPSFVWSGTYYGASYSTLFFILGVQVSPSSIAQDEIQGADFTLSDPSVFYESAQGTWSLDQVPEPGTLLTMLVGALGVAGIGTVRTIRRG